MWRGGTVSLSDTGNPSVVVMTFPRISCNTSWHRIDTGQVDVRHITSAIDTNLLSGGIDER
uniref:Uncharacterized protein n=1 Tax=uncultured marine virus TaxID=186617 RepID=A0A0F7LBB9_9VIRU|nr:hypothetical protein [uncultured marine virus]